VQGVPETKYARADDGVYIAYQVFGEGETWVVGAPGIVSNIEVAWEDPEVARFLEGMGSFSRFIHFDKRGQGLSDRVRDVPTLEQRASDMRAVMDAEGVDTAVVAGISEGGTTAAFFAATTPERVLGLVVFGSFARVLADGDCPGSTPEQLDSLIERWSAAWGSPDTMTTFLIARERVGDRAWIEWLNKYERQSTTPAGLVAQLEWLRDIDIRDVLPSITCPTLVMHRAGDVLIPPDRGRYLADHITGARYVELPGTEHMPLMNNDRPLAEFEAFVTGRARATPTDRVLATVLFTDIVQSTEQASELGDRRWRDVLERHETAARRVIGRFGGRLVKTTGDGLLVVFTGPANGVRCAEELVAMADGQGLRLRAGLHTGEVEQRGDDVAGIAVHIAARVSATAGPGEVIVSRTVKDLVSGSGITFEDRGAHVLKGVDEPWQLLRVAVA
jgi:class 3 adenylate cyclase